MIGNELDNYPAGDTDPYGDVVSFPDEIMRKVAAIYDCKAPHVTINRAVEYQHWTLRYLLLHCRPLLICFMLDALFLMTFLRRIFWMICFPTGREHCLSHPMHHPAGSVHVKTYVLTVLLLFYHADTLHDRPSLTCYLWYLWHFYEIWDLCVLDLECIIQRKTV